MRQQGIHSVAQSHKFKAVSWQHQLDVKIAYS
jgi:hypothetical protein